MNAVAFSTERNARSEHLISVIAVPCSRDYRGAKPATGALALDTGSTHTVLDRRFFAGAELIESLATILADGRRIPTARARAHLYFPTATGEKLITAMVRVLLDGPGHGDGVIGLDLIRDMQLDGPTARTTLSHVDPVLSTEQARDASPIWKAIRNVAVAIEQLHAPPACACEPVLRRC